MATQAEIYLGMRGGDIRKYHQNQIRGQRIGQAFYNALSEQDRDRLFGTMFDPFNHEDENRVNEAITWLLDTEGQVQSRSENKT